MLRRGWRELAMLTDRLRIHAAEGTWVVRAEGAVIGESARAVELVEGHYPPVIYFPREDLGMALLERSDTATTCPFKGEASYFHIATESGLIRDAGWSYETPLPGAARIACHIAFYPDRVTIEQI
jgi:uncharacterized protein (DUF427 family)